VVRHACQLARCRCTFRVTLQTSYSTEYITPTRTKSSLLIFFAANSEEYKNGYSMFFSKWNSQCFAKGNRLNIWLFLFGLTVFDPPPPAYFELSNFIPLSYIKKIKGTSILSEISVTLSPTLIFMKNLGK
jgi:hypothetical protein